MQSTGLARSASQPRVSHDHETGCGGIVATSAAPPLRRRGALARWRRGQHVNGGGKVPSGVVQDALAHVRRAHAHGLLEHDPMQGHSLRGVCIARTAVPTSQLFLINQRCAARGDTKWRRTKGDAASGEASAHCSKIAKKQSRMGQADKSEGTTCGDFSKYRPFEQPPPRLISRAPWHVSPGRRCSGPVWPTPGIEASGCRTETARGRPAGGEERGRGTTMLS